MMAQHEREYYCTQHNDTPLRKYCNVSLERFYIRKFVFILRTVEVFMKTGVNNTTVNRLPHLEPRSDRNFITSPCPTTDAS
jgi:hypothetical protein